ncbi:hypothetical protein EDC18_101490 [Natranaerovirga pectinivora]|uniref:Nucleoside 2-deoxyribosyltransferase-like protein n=1 Tax=Natranaerovirga pectinivora TaxID=682400 RepID=A0A4R3MQM0_9FIRM|nr:nucleoside 2-deoxyribosyltransferase [Natranaerovirga pectinivora]TCT17192.1 hypothetical protein EDC18_101490 [Natranaerovirga pectinivora]
MKAYIAIKYHINLENKELIEEISNALEVNKIKSCCIIRDKEEWGRKTFSVEELMSISFKEIEISDFIVVDLSEKGVGLGIEAGYAYAKGIPIITIAKEGKDISNTLKGISKKIYTYEESSDLVNYFKRLKETSIIHNSI